MTIFRKDEFELCEVPVPEGYPQSQTHCGVICVDGSYILSTSPYPVPKRSKWLVYIMAVLKKISFGIYNPFYVGEDFENPCLYMGEPKENRGYPTIFRLLNGSPVMKKAEDLYGMGSYCSDPDISYHDGLYYLINRTTIRKARTGDVDIDYDTKVHLTIGSICDGGFNIQKQICLFKDKDVSPCMRYYKGRYIYLSLRTTSYNTGRPCEALFLRESMLPEGPWSTKTFINIEKGNYEPWHFSVFDFEDKLYAIIACVRHGEKQRCWQMLGEFDEGLTTLKIYQTPLTDYKSYRGSALVTDYGDFVFYNSVVNEKIKKGKSVDGREVIVASRSFESLIKKINLNT